MTTHSETYQTTKTRRGHTTTTEFKVTYEKTELTEKQKDSSWYAAIGDLITNVATVTVSAAWIFEGKGKHTHPSTYTEISTKFGRACVVNFTEGSQLSGFVGTDGTVRNLGTWKKYGQVRGHGVAWMMVQGTGRGNGRVNPNARKCELACPGEIYARMIAPGDRESHTAAWEEITKRSNVWRTAYTLRKARELVAANA